MAHPTIRAGGDVLVPAVLLYPDDRGEEPVYVHRPNEERQPGGEDRERCDPQRQWNRIGPVEPAIETSNGPMRKTEQEDEIEPRSWRVAAWPHAFPGEVFVDQEEACYRDRGEDPEVSPK